MHVLRVECGLRFRKCDLGLRGSGVHKDFPSALKTRLDKLPGLMDLKSFKQVRNDSMHFMGGQICL